MTKISYIGRIPADEWRDRATVAATGGQTSLPVNSMSRGQLRLELIKAKLQLVRGFYPEMNAEIDAALQLVERAMRGQSAPSAFSTFFMETPLLKDAASEVVRAIDLMHQPAMGGRIDPVDGLGEIPDSILKALSAERPPKGASVIERQRWFAKHKNRVEMAQLLDKEWSKAGHHTLYEFLKKDGTEPALVTTKTFAHTVATSGMANLAEIQRPDIVLWQRLNIAKAHILAGLPPGEPEDAIDFMRKDGEGIGIVWTVPLIIAVISAAAAAAAKIITALQARKLVLSDQLKGYGLEGFGPETEDWKLGKQNPGSGDQTTSTASNNNLLLLGAAAAGLLLLNDKKS